MAKLEAMQTFVKVAETSSFAEAARQLHMSPPAVTRAVSALEEQIGTRLFTRTTRVVRLTEAGSRYFEDCRKILADVEEAEAAASGSSVRPTGVLNVTASVLFGQQFMVPILTEFNNYTKTPPSHMQDNDGLVPRAIHHLFDMIKQQNNL